MGVAVGGTVGVTVGVALGAVPPGGTGVAVGAFEGTGVFPGGSAPDVPAPPPPPPQPTDITKSAKSASHRRIPLDRTERRVGLLDANGYIARGLSA